jgi:hypothetical protein
MLEGRDPTSPEAQAHMDGCAACHVLFSQGTDLASMLAGMQAEQPSGKAPSFADLERQLEGEPDWRTRLAELPSKTRWLLAAAGLTFPVVVGLVRHRHNLSEYPPGRLLVELGVLGGLALAASWLWLRPLYRPQPNHRVLWAVLGIGLVLPWILSSLPTALPDLPTASLAGSHQLSRAGSCFFFGVATALPALLMLIGLGRRRSAFPGFAILPATAAALAGLVALEIHCPVASPSHLLMGHAPVALALPLLLVLSGLWCERSPRRAPRRS